MTPDRVPYRAPKFSNSPSVVSTADTTMVTFRSPSLQVFHNAQPSGLGSTPIRAHTSSYASITPAGMAPGLQHRRSDEADHRPALVQAAVTVEVVMVQSPSKRVHAALEWCRLTRLCLERESSFVGRHHTDAIVEALDLLEIVQVTELG